LIPLARIYLSDFQPALPWVEGINPISDRSIFSGQVDTRHRSNGAAVRKCCILKLLQADSTLFSLFTVSDNYPTQRQLWLGRIIVRFYSGQAAICRVSSESATALQGHCKRALLLTVSYFVANAKTPLQFAGGSAANCAQRSARTLLSRGVQRGDRSEHSAAADDCGGTGESDHRDQSNRCVRAGEKRSEIFVAKTAG
jgi:hypothetical protein